MGMGVLKFTVVICTKDRRADLLRCLESLALELGSADDWDVLVVDNASSDDTSSAALEAAATYPVPLRVIREERLGLSIARNTGLREATGEIAIFVDDDITFLEGWAAAMEAPFADQEVTAVGGPIHPVFPEGVPTWYREGVMADGGTTTGYYEHGEVLREFRPRGEIGHPRGGNMAIRRVRALKIGGFREDLGWGKRKIPGEETEFFGRLSRDGGTIHYVPGARVHHHLDLERTSLKHLRRWHQGYGRASILMNPPKDPVRWVLKFVEQVVNLICYSIRLVLPGGWRSFRAHRKQRQAVGRLAQMLGL